MCKAAVKQAQLSDILFLGSITGDWCHGTNMSMEQFSAF
jgi:hypothetical protein